MGPHFINFKLKQSTLYKSTKTMALSKRFQDIEPFPILSSVGIIIGLVLLFIYRPLRLQQEPVSVYTYSDIYYLTSDSLTSETGNVNYHARYQLLVDSLSSLTALDCYRQGEHTCIDDDHISCDTACICDGLNCDQPQFATPCSK